MGLNCKVKRSYPSPPSNKLTWLDANIKPIKNQAAVICELDATGRLCDPQAETFVDRCSICNKIT